MNLPKIVASVLAICAFSAQAGNAPLKILIVNDDGCESPGSTSLQDKLKAKGYDVWMVRPLLIRAALVLLSPLRPVKFLM